MRALFINNDGGGFPDYVDIAENTTVAQFFAQRLPGSQAQDFLIRVNRQPTSADQILQDGDRISISPIKIAGALPC